MGEKTEGRRGLEVAQRSVRPMLQWQSQKRGRCCSLLDV